MPAATSAITRLVRIALLAAAGDAITKMVAAAWLPDAGWSGGWIGLALVHNDRGAFGFSAGSYTWQLNLALTLSAIALIIPVGRALERLDGRAPEALGLVAGGALGNLASLVLSPFGVLDFIALRTSADSAIVFNAADVAAYVGLALLARTGWRIMLALRDGKGDLCGELAIAPAVVVDAEVKRIVFIEPSAGRQREPGRERTVDRHAPRPEVTREAPRREELAR